MTDTHLHVVSLDVPYPPDYGGAMDIFYKVRALHARGVKIHLHCYEYGRGKAPALQTYCHRVDYYPRRTGWRSNVSRLPYIIRSRRSRQLLTDLEADNHPVLFEGLHTAYPLIARQLGNRICVLRMHNIEHDYYRALAKRERSQVKRAYFVKEAYQLKQALHRLPSATPIAAISPPDTAYLQPDFPATFWLPPFHANERLNIQEGSGTYALYHGNLSVSENVEAAEYLIRAFQGRDIKLVLAGKEPTPELRAWVKASPNIQVVANPSAVSMQEWIQNAHVILLPTFQTTGIKLKLLESLCNGRFCLANQAMVAGTHLEDYVTLADGDFYAATEELMTRPFTASDIQRREAILDGEYSNRRNAGRLLEALKLAER
ncbi:glycosyltransferase [Lewinella sp. IMCC34191]|uniref:glycosyltransferase n=1 Tax=Lewinella sp. IMCC34191 TaxID=2259172 RepID=UPI000E255181|nr:glycosyltransferase [Lewinella sp. IMCC34191]